MYQFKGRNPDRKHNISHVQDLLIPITVSYPMRLPPLVGGEPHQPPRGVKECHILLDPFLQKLWDSKKLARIQQESISCWTGDCSKRIKGSDITESELDLRHGLRSTWNTRTNGGKNLYWLTQASQRGATISWLTRIRKTSGRTHQMTIIINKSAETPKQFSDLLHHIIICGKMICSVMY